jgi:hypothetical protein
VKTQVVLASMLDEFASALPFDDEFVFSSRQRNTTEPISFVRHAVACRIATE